MGAGPLPYLPNNDPNDRGGRPIGNPAPFRPPANLAPVPKTVNNPMGNQGAYSQAPKLEVMPEDDEVMKMLQAFFDQFNSPLDFNDPFVANILNNARATTMQSASNAGVFGPYSQNLAQQAYAKGAAGLQQARQGMAAQALGMLTSYKNDKRNFDQQKARDAYQAAQENWQMQQNSNQDLWKGIAGGLGAIGGGLLGIPGGPAGIIAGATGGFGLGQQIGGAAYQGFGGGANSVPQWNQFAPRGT